MGFRKVNGKKYNSIYEYYKDSDHDKKTIAYYVMYRDLENRPKKIKCDATNKDDALKILNDIKAKLLKDRKEIKRDSSLLHQKIMNNNLSLDDVAKLYFPTKTAKSIDMIKSAYTRLISPTLGQTKIKKLKLKI